jgi:hypothetical protein
MRLRTTKTTKRAMADTAANNPKAVRATKQTFFGVAGSAIVLTSLLSGCGANSRLQLELRQWQFQFGVGEL